MAFNSLEFLFLFLPLFLLAYYPLPLRWKNSLLFFGSLAFYGFGTSWNMGHMALMVGSVAFSFLAAKGIGHCRRKIRIQNGEESEDVKSAGEKAFLTFGLCGHFGLLLYCKYAGYFTEGAALPLGISFYTFQATSYLIDVYRRKTRAEQEMVRLGAYMTMFPKLTAGPIATYREVHKRLRRRKISLIGCNHGLQIFTLGLGLKVLLADRIGNLWGDVQAIGYESISTPLAWLGMSAYSLQIYFDFYGYSLMAVGLGKLLGFHIPDNFKQPYMSHSMTEFWRRWHITLGRWFKEYVYIPLGGSRKGKGRQLVSLFAVWLFTGMWHGASLNFLLWGMFLFFVLVVEKAGLLRILERWKIVGRLYMCFLIPVSWTLFAIENPRDLEVYLFKMFPFFEGGVSQAPVFAGDFEKYAGLYGAWLAVGALCCTGVVEKGFMKWRNKFWMSLLLLLAFVASVYFIYRGMNNPFLYNQF